MNTRHSPITQSDTPGDPTCHLNHPFQPYLFLSSNPLPQFEETAGTLWCLTGLALGHIHGCIWQRVYSASSQDTEISFYMAPCAKYPPWPSSAAPVQLKSEMGSRSAKLLFDGGVCWRLIPLVVSKWKQWLFTSNKSIVCISHLFHFMSTTTLLFGERLVNSSFPKSLPLAKMGSEAPQSSPSNTYVNDQWGFAWFGGQLRVFPTTVQSLH